MATYLISHGVKRFRFGYGSAVAVILFVISFAVAILYQRFVLRRMSRARSAEGGAEMSNVAAAAAPEQPAPPVDAARLVRHARPSSP